MSENLYLQLAFNEQKKKGTKTQGINQADVKREALEIFDATYDGIVCLHLSTDEDRKYFLTKFAEFMGKVLPPEKVKKSRPSRKKQAAARSRFSPKGIFYWKTVTFKGLSDEAQEKWRKSMKKRMPWVAVSKADEALMKSNDEKMGIRYYTSREFKKLSKQKRGEWALLTGLPTDTESYNNYLSTTWAEQYRAWKESEDDKSESD